MIANKIKNRYFYRKDELLRITKSRLVLKRE